MEDKRHPRIKELPFEVPENIDTDAFLFLGDPDGKTKTHFGRYWLTGSATLICAGSVVLGNVLSRRPAISGIHKSVIAGVVGAFAGEWLYGYREKYTAERDLQMFHYMCLHPEDFPKKEPVLFRDYLAPWYPIR